MESRLLHPVSDPELYRQFLALYLETFPVEAERENPDRWLERLGVKPPPGQPATFIQGAITPQETLTGGVVYEFYTRSNCGLITYLAVPASHRRQGIGKMLRNNAILHLEEISGGNLQAVFSEMENPQTVTGGEERARFFEAVGSHKVDINYVQPDLGDGNGPVENLLLLWHPTPTQQSLHPVHLQNFLKEFYQSLGIENPEENNHFQKMTANLPRAAQQEGSMK